MITVKDLMTSGAQSSPNGTNWEPCIPTQYPPTWRYWRYRLRDAWAVWKGTATAIRQTTKADIKEQP